MDHFTLIQHFFTRVQCPSCQSHITEEGVELLREEQGMYMVSIHCNHCDSHVGVAMVGVESGNGHNGELTGRLQLTGARNKRRYKDPELTEAELERLASFAPVSDDDVLAAHHFFESLDSSWMNHIPADLRYRFAKEAVDADPLPQLPQPLAD